MRNRAHSGRLGQAGITLVELMIAIALSLMLLAVLTATFVSNSQTRNEMERTSRQIENGRYAMQVMIDDITNAGFWSGAVTGFADEPEFCATTNINARLLTPSLAVLTKAQAGALSPADCIVDMKDGTNAIVVRRLSTATAPTASAQNCASPLVQAGATCFQVDATSASVTVSPNGSGTTKLLGGEYAALRVPVTHIYYVKDDGKGKKDILMRATLSWSAGAATFTQEEVADGIELLAASLTPSGGSPQRRSVKVEILARNTEGSPGYVDNKTYVVGGTTVGPVKDNIRRQYYSSNVNVENDT